MANLYVSTIKMADFRLLDVIKKFHFNCNKDKQSFDEEAKCELNKPRLLV